MEYADEPRLHFSPLTGQEYCDFYCLEMQDYSADLPFYRALLHPDDRILELGCGNGRLTRLLAPLCRQITGIDISGPMLRQAKNTTSTATTHLANIVYEQKDMLDFSFPSGFDVIIIPYNTLNLLGEEDKVKKCLQLCQKHLAPEGHLGLQLYHPDANVLATAHSQKLFQFIIMDDGAGGKVIKETLKSYHPPSSTLKLEERYRVRPGSGVESYRNLSHTCSLYAPQLPTWVKLFSACGLTISKCAGSPGGEPFRSETETTLFIKATFS